MKRRRHRGAAPAASPGCRPLGNTFDGGPAHIVFCVSLMPLARGVAPWLLALLAERGVAARHPAPVLAHKPSPRLRADREPRDEALRQRSPPLNQRLPSAG
mmetsp:Transcript_13821/g.37494  ORF Transcript_13821/g.37494 Transcript_13821/m.37494 type:complete len:101 (+) Transcript_13821:372-674(+)